MAGEGRKWSRASRAQLFKDLLAQSDEDFAEGLRPEEKEAAGLDLSGYDRALDRASRRVKRYLDGAAQNAQRRERAVEALRRPHPAEDERLFRRFGGRALAEALLHLSFEARYSDPKRMLDFAERAGNVALATAPKGHAPGVIFDLRLRALAESTNAYRVNNLLGDAEDCLEETWAWLPRMSGDPELLARVLVVEASLRIEQRRLLEAGELLERAHEMYREIGEHHLAGRTLVSRARVAYTAGEARTAVQLLEEGLGLLDRKRDPKLVQIGPFKLLLYLTECGEYRRAAELLLESGLAQAFAEEPLNALRLRWVESKIYAGLGRLKRAEVILEEVWNGFRDRDLVYDAALAGLDLAALSLRQGKPNRVLALVEEILATVHRLGLPVVEALRALTLVQMAAEMGVTNGKIIQEAKDFLIRLRADPSLKIDLRGTIGRCLS